MDSTTSRDHNKKKKSRDYFFRAGAGCAAVGDGALRYADLPEQETALAMGVSLGTVKSTTSRALAALGRMLQEEL